MDTQDLNEIKAFLDPYFKDLDKNLTALLLSQQNSERNVREIERYVRDNIITLSKDMTRAFDSLREMEQELKVENGGRVESDISLGKRLTDFETRQSNEWRDHNNGHERDDKDHTKDQKDQAVINDQLLQLRKIVTWLALTFGGFLAYYVFGKVFP